MSAGIHIAQATRATTLRAVASQCRRVNHPDQLEREGAVRVGGFFDHKDRRFVSVWVSANGIVLYCERMRSAVDLPREALLQVAADAGLFGEVPA